MTQTATPTQKKPAAKLAELSEQAVRAYLTGHPDISCDKDITRAYEVAIVSLIDSNDWSAELAKTLFTKLIKDKNQGLAYAAFYALATYYRRKFQVDSYGDLITTGEQWIQNRVSYRFLRLMYKKMKDPNDWNLLREADLLCHRDVMGVNYGVLHCFAEYVAEACEKDSHRAGYYMRQYMDLAMERLDEAIGMDEEYAKFHVTKARLYNIKAIYGNEADRESNFQQAQNEVDQAVAKEDNSAKQINYRLTGVRIQSEYYEKVLSTTIKKQQEEIENQIKDNNVKNLEFLSFFSAIIGLLIAGTQMALNMKFSEGATLLVVLTGCLVTAFGAIGFVLHGTKRRLPVNIIITALGILLTAGAMLYGKFYVG